MHRAVSLYTLCFDDIIKQLRFSIRALHEYTVCFLISLDVLQRFSVRSGGK